MSKQNDNLILLAVIGVGAFFLMQRRGVATPVTMARPVAGTGNSAAQVASAIAGGIAGLFRGGSGLIGSAGNPHSYYGGASPATQAAAQAAAWRDSDPGLNGSVADYVGNDGLAFNPANGGDPWAWAYGMG